MRCGRSSRVATYPTVAELEAYLHKTLDATAAALVLGIAAATFEREADTAWSAKAVTWTTLGHGQTVLEPPFRPITALSTVQVNGVTITGTSLVRNKLYRSAGFGTCGNFPPDEVTVDLVHGITAEALDVKGAILETAAQAYDVPVGAVQSESIDDYAVRYATTGGGLKLTDSAQALAEGYRGALMA